MSRARAQITQGVLDPVMPAALRRYVTESDWTRLGDELYQAFRPAVFHCKCVSLVHMVLVVFLFACFVSIFVVGPLGFALFFALFFITFIIQLCFQISRSCCVEPKVEAATRRVFQEFSASHGNYVTFHLLQDGSGAMQQVKEKSGGGYGRLYITLDYVLEVSVDEESAYRLTTKKGGVPRTHHSAAGDSSSSGSVVERLRKLDDIRHLLSKTEHQEKRKAILGSI